MTPHPWNVTIYQGADFEIFFRLNDGAGTNIVPDEVSCEFRKAPADALWCKGEITMLPDNWVCVRIPASETGKKEWDTRQSGHWDIYIFVNERWYRVIMGEVTVSGRVTQNV